MVRLRIARQEHVPEAAAHKGPDVLGRRLLQGGGARPEIPAHRCRRQRPLQHLGVGGVRNVGPARLRSFVQEGPRRGRAHRSVRLLEHRQKPLQPSLLEHPAMRARPEPELLRVVAVGEDPVAPGPGQLAEVPADGVQRPERDQVSELVIRGKESDGAGGALGDEDAAEALVQKPGEAQVLIVQDRVAHARLRQHFGERRLPDALRDPRPLRADAAPSLPVRGEALDLVERVGARNDGQDRLVEGAAQRLDLPRRHETYDAVDETAIVLLQPLPEAPRKMKGGGHTPMAFEAIEKRRVAQAHGVAEHQVEIPDRLVKVQREQETHAHAAVSKGSRANGGTRVTISLSGAAPAGARRRIRRPTVMPGSRPSAWQDTAISKTLRATARTGAPSEAECGTPFCTSRTTSFKLPLSSRWRRRWRALSPARNDRSRPRPAKSAGPDRGSGSIRRQNSPSRETP